MLKILQLRKVKNGPKAKQIKQQRLVSAINSLCSQISLTDEESKSLQLLQTELDELCQEKAKGAFVCSTARWLENGKNNLSYFLGLENRRQAKKMINRLYMGNSVNENKSDIDNWILSFYTNLYSSKYSTSNTDKFI